MGYASPRPSAASARKASTRASGWSRTAPALEAIAFQQGDRVAEAAAGGGALDVAFTPVINTWRDRRTLELQVRDVRPHGAAH